MAIRQNHSGSGKNITGNKVVRNYNNSDKKKVQSDFDFKKTTRQAIDQNTLKEAFAKGGLDQVFDQLTEYTDDATLQKEISRLKQRWTKNEKDMLAEQINQNDYNVEDEAIKGILLNWIFSW